MKNNTTFQMKSEISFFRKMITFTESENAIKMRPNFAEYNIKGVIIDLDKLNGKISIEPVKMGIHSQPLLTGGSVLLSN